MRTIINLRPVRLIDQPEQLMIDIDGLLVYVNGEEYDFSPLDVGDILPAEAIDDPLFDGPVTRTVDGLILHIMFPLGSYAPYEARFPEPIVVTENGSVDIPEFYGLPPDHMEIPEIPEELSDEQNQLLLEALGRGTAGTGEGTQDPRGESA